VPQMADSETIAAKWGRKSKLRRAWVLVPNSKGLDRAIATRVRDIAVFTAVSETFNRKNIGLSVSESLAELAHVVHRARKNGMRVRGYVSTAYFCPFEGPIKPRQALRILEKILELGVEEVSVGDTIGAATPRDIDRLLTPAFALLGGPTRFAGHFHDTRGTALANTLRALELGMRSFDASAGGLGGCPFAPGAAGNLATEDLLYLLDGMGMKTGVDLARVCRASLALRKAMSGQGAMAPIRSRYLASTIGAGRSRTP
ncbi:MAG: hydroxymethylglutaryl-CoA lyase, partial [Bdellovibrionota bacterium]